MSEQLERVGLVPDVIPLGYKLPTAAYPVTITVNYPVGAAMAGRILTPAQAAERPEVIFSAPPRPNSSYVVAMVDPDVRGGQYLHWIASDIIESKVTPKATETTQYMGPAPPTGNKYHRYTFLLFSRDKIGEFASPAPTEDNRGGFNVMDWARANAMTLLAAEYFNCKKN